MSSAQAALLRALNGRLHRAALTIEKVPEDRWKPVLNRLEGNLRSAPGRKAYFDDKQLIGDFQSAVARLLTRWQSEVDIVSVFAPLHVELSELVAMLRRIDTTTDGIIFLQGYPREKHHVSHSSPAGIDHIRLGLCRLIGATGAVLERHERQMGPEASKSLQWLVGELSRIWERETATRVAGNCVGHGDRSATPAGCFTLSAVEALYPSTGNIGRRLPKRALGFSPDRDSALRRGRVHQAIRKYIAGRREPVNEVQ
jgi:hypothetical protein